eukprot:765269-Hanusia_phi.AAC.2
MPEPLRALLYPATPSKRVDLIQRAAAVSCFSRGSSADRQLACSLQGAAAKIPRGQGNSSCYPNFSPRTQTCRSSDERPTAYHSPAWGWKKARTTICKQMYHQPAQGLMNKLVFSAINALSVQTKLQLIVTNWCKRSQAPAVCVPACSSDVIPGVITRSRTLLNHGQA